MILVKINWKGLRWCYSNNKSLLLSSRAITNFDILTLKLLQIIICKSWINVFAEVNFRHFTFETCSSAALQFASTIHDVLDFSSIVLLRIKTRGDQYTCCQTHATTIVTMASGILIFGIYFFYYLYCSSCSRVTRD